MLQRPTPAAAVAVEDLDDDVCLYRSDTDEVLVLNRSAADVWRLCDGELTVVQIVAALATAYATEPAAVQRDVEAVVDDLRSRGYLVERAPTATRDVT